MTEPRIPRLDAHASLTGLPVPLVYEGPCPGGQVGAAYVRWPDGHRSVLTRGPDVGALMEVARAGGVPAPRYELVRGSVVVQELLPGSTPVDPTSVTVRSMIEVNRLCRGLLAGRTDLPAMDLYLRADGPGFCLHEPLRAYDRRTRRLLDQVEEVGAALPVTLDGDDLVHTDFHPENVLVDATGRVTGVVDWDGATRGDGRFDLYTLRFDLARRSPRLLTGPEGLGGLGGLGAELDALVGAEVALAAWAHMSLRLVDWSIRHHTAAHVTTWLGIADHLKPR